jgi:hypothetical protein
VLAELCRRDLVPALWVPPLEDRELRERLRRRMHLVRMRASAMNRIFGVLTQWGLRLSLRRLREPDAMGLLAQRGVPEVWRDSIAEAPDGDRPARRAQSARSTPSSDPWPAPIPACGCWTRFPASETCSGSRSRRRSATSPASARRASSSATPAWPLRAPVRRPRQDRGAVEGRLRTLGWAAVEAAQHAWRPTNPWHPLYTDIATRAGKNPAKSAVARKILIAAWHVLSRDEAFKPAAPRRPSPASASSRCFLAA